MFERTGAAIDLGDALLELSKDQAEWSRATFGADDVRGPAGPMEHLRKEAKECLRALKDHRKYAAKNGSYHPNEDEWRVYRHMVESEFADILILLLDSSRRFGMTPLQLVQAAASKMAENKTREWKPLSEQDPDRPVEHTKPRERRGKK